MQECDNYLYFIRAFLNMSDVRSDDEMPSGEMAVGSEVTQTTLERWEREMNFSTAIFDPIMSRLKGKYMYAVYAGDGSLFVLEKIGEDFVV